MFSCTWGLIFFMTTVNSKFFSYNQLTSYGIRYESYEGLSYLVIFKLLSHKIQRIFLDTIEAFSLICLNSLTLL